MKKAILIICIICIPQISIIIGQNPSLSYLPLEETIVVKDTTFELAIDSITVTLITSDMPHAQVYQDSSITQMMHDKRIGYVRGKQIKNGFRVQVYASNHQQVAKREATELQQHIEAAVDVPVYTISEPPFWKVRIGNFESREAANEYKITFLLLFPELISSTYVVPDKIILLQ